MASELITTEYAGRSSRQVGTLPWHDVHAWWIVRDEGTIGRVKLSAGRALKKHLPKGMHVEFVHMDMDTYGSPHMNAMLTFRVLTPEDFAARASLRTRLYLQCDGCGNDQPDQLVRMEADKSERALCFTCWHPISSTCQVLHSINRHGKLQA